jgi:phosphoglucomutase
MNVREVATKPYNDQKPGTAGLRKKVAVFQQPHYLENFLQAIFDVDSRLAGARLVIGGDGRYHNREAIQTALRIAAANGVKHAIVGQGGLLSTPAASHAIRRHNAAGGFLFTASHNPAGPDGDFGIKFNVAGGGQASESITGRIYEVSRTISRYRIVDAEPVDLDRRGSSRLGDMEVEIIDCVDDYAALMQQLFDFDQIRSWFRAGHRIRFDAMHAVTGPYARRIFIDLLGAPEDSLQNAIPLEDFGGGHPDPNLIYAKHLVDVMYGPDAPDFGAASDGDGDRNMIVGRGMFVSPGDSLAMLAAHLHRLPGYKGGLVGVARSMPTCRAVDKVAAAIDLPCFETPTGWKFFANLLDANRITLCGEESFGTSSNHTREKDGVWAALAWINILAATGHSVAEIAQQHWRRYGRHYYARHDYEALSLKVADKVMDAMRSTQTELSGKPFADYEVTLADEFGYEDPIDGSRAEAQGLRIVFGDHARIVLRKSGTGTQGATLRLYLERYETDPERLDWSTAEALKPIVDIADRLVRIGELTGRKAPDVVT